jgi:hypothetical protein
MPANRHAERLGNGEVPATLAVAAAEAMPMLAPTMVSLG